jgi:hypothetical protein
MTSFEMRTVIVDPVYESHYLIEVRLRARKPRDSGVRRAGQLRIVRPVGLHFDPHVNLTIGVTGFQ